MRRFSLALLACFTALSSAFADRSWIESSVTLSLTLTETGETKNRPSSKGTETVTAGLDRRRFGNADIVSIMKEKGLIAETKGWRLVALWENWSEWTETYGYRFHLKRGKGASTEFVAVPSSLLQLELLSSLATQKLKYDADQFLASGSESNQTLARLNFELPSLYFQAGGILQSSGRYTRPRSASTDATFLPGSGKTTLQGLYQRRVGEDDYRYGVAAGALSFGSAQQVLIKDPTGGGSAGPGSQGPGMPDVDTSISVSVN